jgi:hypothetical protein
MKQEKPDYNVLLEEGKRPEPYFTFTKEQKRFVAGMYPVWRLAPDDKRIPVHEVANTCDSLLNVYPDAIEVGTPLGSGDKMWFGLLGAVFGVLASIELSYSVVSDMQRSSWFLGGGTFLAVLFFLLITWFFIRLAFFTPKDLPTLFNRKTRQVIFYRYRYPPFWKFWTTRALGDPVVRSWDASKARSYKWTQFTGSAGRESYQLCLLWGRQDDPTQCEDIVIIGYRGWWEDAKLWRLYEHIRRYMEEGGPAINPGETLRRSGTGKLPTFSSQVIAAAGGPALSADAVYKLAGLEPAG